MVSKLISFYTVPFYTITGVQGSPTHTYLKPEHSCLFFHFWEEKDT
jgi:hypothetical protein